MLPPKHPANSSQNIVSGIVSNQSSKLLPQLNSQSSMQAKNAHQSQEKFSLNPNLISVLNKPIDNNSQSLQNHEQRSKSLTSLQNINQNSKNNQSETIGFNRFLGNDRKVTTPLQLGLNHNLYEFQEETIKNNSQSNLGVANQFSSTKSATPSNNDYFKMYQNKDATNGNSRNQSIIQNLSKNSQNNNSSINQSKSNQISPEQKQKSKRNLSQDFQKQIMNVSGTLQQKLSSSNLNQSQLSDKLTQKLNLNTSKNGMSDALQNSLLSKLRNFAQAPAPTSIEQSQSVKNSSFNFRKVLESKMQSDQINDKSLVPSLIQQSMLNTSSNVSLNQTLSSSYQIKPQYTDNNYQFSQKSLLFTSPAPNYKSNPYNKPPILNPNLSQNNIVQARGGVLGEKLKQQFLKQSMTNTTSPDQINNEDLWQVSDNSGMSRQNNNQLFPKNSASTMNLGETSQTSNITGVPNFLKNNQEMRLGSSKNLNIDSNNITMKPPLSKISPNTSINKDSQFMSKESSIALMRKMREISTFQDVIDNYKPLIQQDQQSVWPQSLADQETSYQPTYSFQKQHPTFGNSKLRYNLNSENQKALENEKEQYERLENERKLKEQLEKDKIQNQLSKYSIMNIKDLVLDKTAYEAVKKQDKQKVQNIVQRIKQKWVEKAVFAYKCLCYKKQISKYFSMYCIQIYKEMLRQQHAQLVFDDIDSDRESPDKKKNKNKSKQKGNGGNQFKNRKKSEDDELIINQEEIHQQKLKLLKKSVLSNNDGKPQQFQEQNSYSGMDLKSKLRQNFQKKIQAISSQAGVLKLFNNDPEDQGGQPQQSFLYKFDDENISNGNLGNTIINNNKYSIDDDFEKIINDELEFQDMQQSQKLNFNQKKREQDHQKQQLLQQQKKVSKEVLDNYKKRKEQIKFINNRKKIK